ncbi:chemotaxis protein CheW [Chitinibacter bivalviorum]|uniref:Chemotaxis protein CheA n=1 Tax=Chitinibacter bivalviorum TaxID=2739434 RepID=A0A7H9BIB9_9NEIS|nr:chemotaxis protein CheW [Chitinibacter bivalviorum]QLG88092.1 chemotaxis protein CheW [Chitinibacter bivalviorum]
MTIDMSQFISVFFDEAAEHLANMESLLLKIDVSAPDPEDLNAIFRAAHSIKGGAATFGFTDLTEVTHVLENLLDRIRKNEIILQPEMVDVFLQSGDVLQAILASHRDHIDLDRAAIASITATLNHLVENQPIAAPANQSALTLIISAGEDFDAVQLNHELSRLGEIEDYEPGDVATPWLYRLKTAFDIQKLIDSLAFVVAPERISIESSADMSQDFGLFLPETEEGAISLDEGYGFFEPLESSTQTASEDDGYGFFEPLPTSANAQIPASAPLQDGEGYGFFQAIKPTTSTAPVATNQPIEMPAPATTRVPNERATDKAVDTSIRVSVEKVDQLLNLVGELVITQSMLAQNALQLDPVLHEKLLSGVAQLERNTRELQESVMSIRMMPISFVFNRYPRLVRDLAAKLGKQVELKMIGDNTELDKGFIEKLSDPLTHLVRNSLDHGIELPDVRTSRNKQAQGTLTLKAFHQGGNIVIEVSDDGAGLSRERILAKAKERGLNVSDSMSDNEVWMLIFEAGFSTASEITDVSGRGVGMDVVRKNIQSMGGRVEIQSMQGIGSTMSIRLPLTLAILDGMSISASDELYIIPLTFIVESLQPKSSEIKTMAGRGNVINVRGEYLPLIALYEIFNLKPKINSFEEGLVIILEAEGQKIALFVDDLLGQHQVVVKNLETNYRRVNGVAGATIMGDGHVAFILDVAALVKMAQHVTPTELTAMAA